MDIPQPAQSLAEVLYNRAVPDNGTQVPAAMLGRLVGSGFLRGGGPFAMTSTGKPILPDYVNSTPMYGSGALTPQLGQMYQNYWTSIFYPRS